MWQKQELVGMEAIGIEMSTTVLGSSRIPMIKGMNRQNK